MKKLLINWLITSLCRLSDDWSFTVDTMEETYINVPENLKSDCVQKYTFKFFYKPRKKEIQEWLNK